MQSGGVAQCAQRALCTEHPQDTCPNEETYLVQKYSLSCLHYRAETLGIFSPWKAAWPLNAAPTRYTVCWLKQVCARVNSSNELVKDSYENNLVDALPCQRRRGWLQFKFQQAMEIASHQIGTVRGTKTHQRSAASVEGIGFKVVSTENHKHLSFFLFSLTCLQVVTRLSDSC